MSKSLENTVVTLHTAPVSVDLGQAASLSWLFWPPAGCSMFDRVPVNGQHRGLVGSTVVQPGGTTAYPVMLIVPGGLATYGPMTVTVNLCVPNWAECT